MKKSRIFWGLLFISGAVLLILDRIGLVGNINIISVFVTLILVYCLIKGIIYRSYGSIIFPIALLCIMYDDMLGITFIGTGTILLAATLLTIGFSFLFPNQKSYHHNDTNTQEYDRSHMQFHTTFKESIQYINSSQFERADVHCKFGHSKIYLDNAKMKEDYACINIEGSFCEVDLFVPKEWAVDNRIECLFGGVEENNRSQNQSTPMLVIQGKITFGGLTITYI